MQNYNNISTQYETTLVSLVISYAYQGQFVRNSP